MDCFATSRNNVFFSPHFCWNWMASSQNYSIPSKFSDFQSTLPVFDIGIIRQDSVVCQVQPSSCGSSFFIFTGVYLPLMIVVVLEFACHRHPRVILNTPSSTFGLSELATLLLKFWARRPRPNYVTCCICWKQGKQGSTYRGSFFENCGSTIVLPVWTHVMEFSWHDCLGIEDDANVYPKTKSSNNSKYHYSYHY
jgi:hypothetical protein